MTRRDAAELVALFLLAFALRFHDLGRPAQRWSDEENNLDGAVHYWEAGQFEPDTWEHPPLRNLSAYAFLSALGDNPYGWRMRNVLFGSAAAVLAWLLARGCGGRNAALLAGVLVATDPLHVVLSRFTYEEIYGGSLFLAAVVLFVWRRGRSGWVVASAFFAGCALATKWYYAPGWALMLALLVRESRFDRDPRTLAFLASSWLLVPLAVFVGAYYPWFGRGYGLAELPEHVLNGYYHLQAMTEYTVAATDLRPVFQGHTSPLEWFVRPIWIGDGMLVGPDRGVFLMYVNDFPVWVLALPAAFATLVLAARRRALELAIPALFFLALYALFLPVSRPMFVYSAAPLLPFAFGAVALAVERAAARFGPSVSRAALALVLGWNLYLYPLVAAKAVPLGPYRWLLERAEILFH